LYNERSAPFTHTTALIQIDVRDFLADQRVELWRSEMKLVDEARARRFQFDAGSAAFAEQLAGAIGRRRFLVTAGEALAGQAAVAVGAGEALWVPGLLLVRHAARGDD